MLKQVKSDKFVAAPLFLVFDTGKQAGLLKKTPKICVGQLFLMDNWESQDGWGSGKPKMSHPTAGSEAALKITHPAWLGNSKKDQQLPPGIAN